MKKCLAFLLALLLPNLWMESGCAESAVSVGDIVFSDGSVVSSKSLSAWDEACFPVAVVAAVYADGSILGVATHRSDEPLPWASEGGAGETTRFSALESWIDGAEEGQADQVDFEGLTDGSDSWPLLCAADEYAADVDYPAFAFAHAYAETYDLTGDMADGWYLPSIAEVCAIYANREAVNASLRLIHALDDAAAMDGLGTNWYWSSSQSSARDDYAWFVHYFNGYVSDCPKNFTNLHALAVKRF